MWLYLGLVYVCDYVYVAVPVTVYVTVNITLIMWHYRYEFVCTCFWNRVCGYVTVSMDFATPWKVTDINLMMH